MVDEPFCPDDSDEHGGLSEPLPTVNREPTPEETHKWGVEKFKNETAFKIVKFCLISIMSLALIDLIPCADGDSLDRASDVFKLIGTTALGYLFGRNNEHGS